MDNILEYIKNIGFFLILVSVVCNALPDNSFKKYCRLFCGLVLVIMVLSPIDAILNFDGDIADIFTTKTYGAKLDELESKLKLQEQLELDTAMVEYEAGLKEMLDDIATEQGLNITCVKVAYEYDNEEEMVLTGLTFSLSKLDVAKDGEEVIDNASSHNSADTNDDGINQVESIRGISNVDVKESTDHNSASSISDIDGLSLADRPKVIEFVREAAKRLEIDSSYITVIWTE